MLKEFLREHRHGLYMELLLSGKSVMHLNEVDNKARHQMAWVGMMDNIRNAAEKLCCEKWFLTFNSTV